MTTTIEYTDLDGRRVRASYPNGFPPHLRIATLAGEMVYIGPIMGVEEHAQWVSAVDLIRRMCAVGREPGTDREAGQASEGEADADL